MPTTDLQSLFKSLLLDHLATSKEDIESAVFPGSSAAAYIDDLV